mmetsp:Transcript_16123/g.19766  ORF Transcript_16123/g.19766 Transcript_16123/m.19766 type:complete len:370 (-) Transcript_16123:344-1453(-)
MLLVFLGQSLKDGQGLFIGWLRHVHWLETAFQCLVLLDVLPVLLNGRGANDLQLATRQRRLHDVARINGTTTISCTTRTNNGVDLVNHQNDLFLRVKYFLDNVLQTFLEFTTVAGTGQQHGQIKLHNALALQKLRNITCHNLLCQTLGDGGLANARLSNEHWVVLLATCQNLDGSLQLSSTTNKRIHFSFLCSLGQVVAELFQRHGLARAAAARGDAHQAAFVLLLELLDNLFWHLRRVNAQLFQDLDGISIILFEEGQQDVRSINGVGIQPLGLFHSIAQHALGGRGEGNFHGDHASATSYHLFHGLSRLLQGHIKLLQDLSGRATGVGHHTHQQHLGAHVVVTQTTGFLLGHHHSLDGFLVESLEHH